MEIRLKSVKNIRDFSEFGYKGYIRSAHLNRLSPADAKTLTDTYKLKTIIDLRTTQEVREKPDAAIPGVDYIHIPLFDEAVPGISHEAATDKWTSMIPDMDKMYAALVTQEPYLSQIGAVMEVIFDPQRTGAVLWHCTEGKDRCGIISALFLLSRKVQPQAVMEDYLQTNRVNTRKARRYYVLICMVGKGAAFAAKVRDAFLAKPAYLEPIMDTLQALAGTYYDR